MLSMLLQLDGFVVDSAADGRTGLQAALDNPPDVILSDLHMPHMNGYQLLAAVRCSPTLNRTRVVFLTGEARQEPAPVPAELRPDGRLLKPCTREQLLQVLNSIKP